MNTAFRRQVLPLLLAAATLTPLHAQRQIPEALKPWQDWATWNDPHRHCPVPWNNPQSPLCLWPSELSLSADAGGGSFRFSVTLHHESWIPLPGNADVWPQSVTANGNPAVVLEREGRPALFLPAGSHQIAGAYQWSEMPQRLPLPREIGILALTVEGRPVDSPAWDPSGTLWLKRTREEGAAKDSLSVQIYRVIGDGIPLWLDTEIELTVSGKSREEPLGHLLPEGWKLASIDSPIPVAVDDQGRVKAQVRAGKWTLAARAFRATPLQTFRYAPGTQPILDSELVAFQADPAFRLLELTGLPAVDASQTTFPEKWRQLPVYQWNTATEFKLEERLRGMGLQRPEGLRIRRTLWLDEDGSAFTAQDMLTGAAQQLWRLDAAPGLTPGSVKLNGQSQLITQNPANGRPGVEIRERNLRLESIGRLDRAKSLPATGWDTNAESAAATLQLPPGWRALALFGPEQVYGDWFHAWTTLDFFLLAIFALAVFRLWGPTAGLLAFAAIALAYHEPGSPRYAWFFLLVPLALLRAIPPGWPRLIVRAWKYAAVAVLLLFLAPFVATQLQGVLYPQLEPVHPHYGPSGAAAYGVGDEAPVLNEAVDTLAVAPAESMDGKAAGIMKRALRSEVAASAPAARHKANANLFQDANARIQTGPAVPQWSWRTVNFSWTGPVAASETIRPILIPPGLQRLLTVLRVALLIALAAWMLDLKAIWKPGRLSALLPFLVLFTLLTSSPANAQDIPDNATLQTLRDRLLEPHPSFPHAADIPAATLRLGDRSLSMDVEIHLATQAAVPLPGRLPAWSPVSVKTADGRRPALRRDDGFLWIVLPAGVHKVRVEGLLPDTSEWEWAFLLKPRQVTVEAPGWTVTGLRPNGVPEAQLFFARQKTRTDAEAAYDRRDFNPIVSIDRHLEIGLVWQVRTTVTRLAAPGKAVALEVPLLPGEKVLTPGVNVTGGRVEARLAANQDRFSWAGELTTTAQLQLTAADTDRWVERWHVAASPVWNLKLSGLGPVFEDGGNALTPVWRPWPGESIALDISRPEALPGEVVTVRRVHREVALGNRQRTTTLTLDLICSLGQDFRIGIDPAAVITQLKSAGQPLPVRRDGDVLIVPLRPGEQQVEITWQENTTLGFHTTAAAVTLPADSANITTVFHVPDNRWTLWTAGPLRGPAVRFWIILLASLIAAWLLGHLTLSPLRPSAWVILALGLTQIDLWAALLVVAWLFLLAWRGGGARSVLAPWLFNCLQVLLILLTLAATAVLVAVAYNGLLGDPDMFIQGNGSSTRDLIWYSPQASGALPAPSLWSVSHWFYRLAMLFWAFWLAFSFINWLRWGWTQYLKDGFWKPRTPKPAPPPPKAS